jgi:pyrroline-5-carboxylate reductase
MAELKKLTITFIGGGNMANALIRGLIHAGVPSTSIRAAEPVHDRRRALVEQYAISVFPDNCAAVAGAHLVVIAVKPVMVSAVLAEIAPHLASGTLVVSIAAGIALHQLVRALPAGQPVVRVMPNTPSLIGAGIAALCPAPGTPLAALEQAQSLMQAVGEVVTIENEELMDGITALSASGPAYVFLMAEALSDGGVACGLPRELADRLAVETLAGSARLIADSGKHPGELKNQVTSPAGTTIAGLMELERAGVRGSLISAVVAAWKRARELRADSLLTRDRKEQ